MRLSTAMKMGLGAVLGNVFETRVPLNVMFSVTNRCTARCSYCQIPKRQQRELTTAESLDLIDQLAAEGTQRIGLWGGEPLVRDDIGELVDRAKQRGMYVTLDTNGHLLEQRIDQLASLDHLLISFDGSPEAHAANRGEDTFPVVMRAIELASGRLPLWTITVLTKHNLDCIDYILEMSRKYRFIPTFQLLHHNEFLGRNHANLVPSREEYRRAIRHLIRRKREGVWMGSSYKYLSYVLRWQDYESPTSDEVKCGLRCWAGRLYANVDTDGSVYPCSVLVEKMPVKNFLEVGFHRAFREMPRFSCKACTAACFTEYNYLYSLDPLTMYEWMSRIWRKP